MNDMIVKPSPPIANAMFPRPYRVREVVTETHDTFTITLDPVAGGPYGTGSGSDRVAFSFEPGQFNMLYLFGIGEVPISMSGDPAHTGHLVHTIRAVGSVTNPMKKIEPGTVLGVRGPFGS
ncbi:MAG TPA: hypothetical protein VEZ90_03520, partial [Blastocatellia bacterium]|nr:hypothetical protein [Blastocatellia bacterium]